MRQIKFRAWGKNSKEFLQDAKGYGLTLKEIQNIHDVDVWEFSQFTGLHDKNGKEIYEGDIVKHKNETVGEVSWRCNGFTVVEAKTFHNSLQDEWEVIGNIFETPELLK